jgi:hypothetical protein
LTSAHSVQRASLDAFLVNAGLPFFHPKCLSQPSATLLSTQVGVRDDIYVRKPTKGLRFANENDAVVPPQPLLGRRACFLHPYTNEVPTERSPFSTARDDLYLTSGTGTGRTYTVALMKVLLPTSILIP